MANKKYEETDVQAIAEAIREKTGSEDSYKVSDMASGVNEVYEKGYSEGEMYLWRAITGPNSVSSYFRPFKCTFYSYPYDEFNPPYEINAYSGGNASECFREAKIKKLKKGTVWFGGKKQSCGSATSNGYGLSNAFNSCPNLEEIEDVGLGSACYYAAFSGCKKLRKIAIISPSDSTVFTYAFRNCSSLEEITFAETIGRDISFSQSPLTVASLKSIITHLKDYSGTTSEYTYTVTFKSTAFSALEAEGATAEYNGVACMWTELIDNLKWNLELA